MASSVSRSIHMLEKANNSAGFQTPVWGWAFVSLILVSSHCFGGPLQLSWMVPWPSSEPCSPEQTSSRVAATKGLHLPRASTSIPPGRSCPLCIELLSIQRLPFPRPRALCRLLFSLSCPPCPRCSALFSEWMPSLSSRSSPKRIVVDLTHLPLFLDRKVATRSA